MAVCLCAPVAGTAVGFAGAADGQGPATPAVEGPELTVEGRFSPAVFSRHAQTPIKLDARGTIQQRGAPEGHPVAIREIRIESADLEIHTGGIPVCSPGQLQATETRVAERVCGPAMIGAGSATAQVALAERRPVNVRADLLVFNGGKADGKTTLLVHTYFSDPILVAIVTTVTVTDLPGARFGTLAVAKVPQIEGGDGSIVRFHLTIDRNVMGHHPVSATCEGGRVRAYLEGRYEDGARSTSEVINPCRPHGPVS